MYTSSDPENFNRDIDSNSLASTSTDPSQPSKGKKKPWSKFKSSFKSIGDKMSSKPKFPEQTEGGEQKKSKKNKKAKSSGKGEDVKPSPGDKEKDKSPPLAKSLDKKLSVESLPTSYVGYQPKSVSPGMTYAKALNKDGSTSESNLSTSDMDSPKRVLTLDKNTKYNLTAQESPDSGRVSQEGREASSDFSLESDYTLGSQKASVTNLDASGSKTIKEKDIDVSVEFIKMETKVDIPKLPKESSTSQLSETKDSLKTPEEEGRSEHKEQLPKTETKDLLLKDDSSQEVSKTNKKPNISSKNHDNSSIDLIKAEQSNVNIDYTSTQSPSSSKNISIKTQFETKEDKSKEIKVEMEKDISSNSKINTTEADQNSETIETIITKSDKNDNSSHDVPSTSLAIGNDMSSDSTAEVKKNEDNTTPELEENHEKPNISSKTEDVKDNEKDTSDTKESPKNSLEGNDKVVTPTDMNRSSTSSTPSESSAPPDPSMSMEQKLQAFLDSEGWTGAIKGVSVRADTDGSQQPDKRECLYKILVIGELGTGKTSIIKRYVHQFFSQHYRATIGVDFALKVLNWDPNTIIRLQLWDIAGQERFGNMTRVYYKEAVGAFIVFDVTRSATFDAVLKWKQDLDSKVQLADGSSIPCVLLANKCDQQKEGIVNTPAKMEEYCKENNFSAWFETSAKENINIDEAAKSLVTQILQNDKMSQNGRDSAREGGKFPLEEKSEQEGKSCAC